jgi:hypothetical protein
MAVRSRVLVAATLAAGAAVAGCNSLYWPTAPDANWTIHDTPRLSLYVRPGSFCESVAEAVGEVLEDQYDHATSILALRSTGRVAMFLYNAGSELTPPLPSNHSGVAFPHTGAVHAACVPPLDDNLRSLLTHELNHVIIGQGLGQAGTSFMNEGLASAITSERLSPIGPSFLYAWTRSRRAELPSIATLADDSRWSSSSELGYKTSASFLAWLLERYGHERLRQVYYARSGELAQRTSSTYGTSLEQLEAEWHSFLAAGTTLGVARAQAAVP